MIARSFRYIQIDMNTIILIDLEFDSVLIHTIILADACDAEEVGWYQDGTR